MAGTMSNENAVRGDYPGCDAGPVAAFGNTGLSHGLKRPDNEVSRLVPAVSRCKYSNRICKMPYWQGFPAFVPVVPVVPAYFGRGRKKKPCNRRARRGRGANAFALN